MGPAIPNAKYGADRVCSSGRLRALAVRDAAQQANHVICCSARVSIYTDRPFAALPQFRPVTELLSPSDEPVSTPAPDPS
jgi:hypothetical protein